MGHEETTWHGAGCEEPRAPRAHVEPRRGERPQPRACRDRRGHCSSLGLSPAWKRQSTVIIVINCFISHTTFYLPDSPAARKGRCLSGAGRGRVRGTTAPTHPCTLPLLSFLPRDLGCKRHPRAGAVLPNTHKSSLCPSSPIWSQQTGPQAPAPPPWDLTALGCRRRSRGRRWLKRPPQICQPAPKPPTQSLCRDHTQAPSPARSDSVPPLHEFSLSALQCDSSRSWAQTRGGYGLPGMHPPSRGPQELSTTAPTMETRSCSVGSQELQIGSPRGREPQILLSLWATESSHGPPKFSWGHLQSTCWC